MKYRHVMLENKPAHHNDQIQAVMKLKAARKAYHRNQRKAKGKTITSSSPSSLYFP